MIRAATYDEITQASKAMGYHPSGCVKGVAFLEAQSVSACVLFDHWTPHAVQVHVYAPSLGALFSPVYLRELFHYAFVSAGRGLLVAVTPANQKGSLAVSAWLGFKETYRIKEGWAQGVDMVVKELRIADCRYLRQAVQLAS